MRPPIAPTAPPTAAPRAAPWPPAAAAPIAAPLPAPIRPPPIVRWTGSYGLVQADNPKSSTTGSMRGASRDFVISLVRRLVSSIDGLDLSVSRIQTVGRKPKFRRTSVYGCY